MKRKIILAILSVVVSASVILTPSLSAFAFGQWSFNDDTIIGYDTHYFWSDNGKTNIKTAGMPAYHIKFEHLEVIEWLHTVSNPDDYVSGCIIYVPVRDRYMFVVKQKTSVNVDGYYLNYNTHVRESAFFYTLAFGDFDNDSYDAGNGSRNRTMACVNGVLPPITPYRLWFNSYYYLFFDINSKGSSGSYISAQGTPIQQYEAQRYSEMKQEELDALIEASGASDLEGATPLGGISATMDELTEPAVDAESESESYSEQFSNIESMIDNIDNFSSLASSNYADVSSQLSAVRGGIDEVSGWLPSGIIAIIVLGLVVIVVVKVLGR